MPKQKSAIKYCDGCLSSSLTRPLKPIEEFYEVYILLMNTKIHNTGQDTFPLMCWECLAMLWNFVKYQQRFRDTFPLMCWECLAMLRNFVKYQQRFKLANNYLSKRIGKTKRKVMYLSDLIETYNDTWYEMQHEETESYIPYQAVPLTLNNIQESGPETVINIESDEDVAGTDCESIVQEMECKQDVIEIENEGMEIKTEIQEIGNEEIESNEEIKEIGLKRNVGKKISVLSVTKPPTDNKYYYTKRINEEERVKLVEEKKILSDYKKRPFKCDTCIKGFTTDGWEKHYRMFHWKSTDYECHYCGCRMKSKRSLVSHIRGHYRKYVCASCEYSCLSECDIKRHAVTHVWASCLKCGKDFGNLKEMNDHHHNSHSRVQCDDCHKSVSSKDRLIQHIRWLIVSK